jgi:hypothetical protein
MLQDVDLRYQAGKLATDKNVTLNGTLTVGGAATLNSSLAVTGAVTVGGTVLADPNISLPGDHGLISWSYDPSFASSNQLLTNGTVYLSAVRIRRATTISKVWWLASTVGATPTTGQNVAGLYSSAGTLLSSVNVDSLVTGSNSAQNATLAAAQAVTAGLYWVGLVFNASTAPTLLRTNGAFAGTNNANLGVSGYRYATNGTSQTTLPSPITPSSNSTGPSLWVGAS